MNGNQNWDLKSFIETLSAELDEAMDNLRIKSFNRPLTYSVQDVALKLNVFAQFDGDTVKFRTALPNEEGASNLELKLGSVTDRVVAETTKPPPKAGERLDDVPLPGLDEETKSSLRKLGAKSVDDVKRLARQKVKVRTNRGEEVDFAHLADQLETARFNRRPQVRKVQSFPAPQGSLVRLSGADFSSVRPESVRLNGAAVQTSISDDQLDFLAPEGAAGELTLETLGGESILVRLVD